MQTRFWEYSSVTKPVLDFSPSPPLKLLKLISARAGPPPPPTNGGWTYVSCQGSLVEAWRWVLFIYVRFEASIFLNVSYLLFQWQNSLIITAIKLTSLHFAANSETFKIDTDFQVKQSYRLFQTVAPVCFSWIKKLTFNFKIFGER